MFQNLLNKTMFNVYRRRSKSGKSRSKSLKKSSRKSRSKSRSKRLKNSRSKRLKKSPRKSRSKSKSKGRMSYLLQQAISKTEIRSIDWMRSAYSIFSELWTNSRLDANLQVFSRVCLGATVAMIRRHSLNIQGIDYSTYQPSWIVFEDVQSPIPMKYVNAELRESLRILRDDFKETWVTPLFGNCLGIRPFQRQDDMENCLTDEMYLFICNTFVRRLKSWVNQNKNHEYAKKYLTYVSRLENPRNQFNQLNTQIKIVSDSGPRIRQTGREDELPIYGRKPAGGLDDDIHQYNSDVKKWHDEVAEWETKNKIKDIINRVNYMNPNAPTRNFKITPKPKPNEPKRRPPKKTFFDDWF